MSVGLTVALIAFLIGLNAWLVAAEYAVVTVSRDAVVARKDQGSRRARVLLRIVDDLEPAVATIRFFSFTILLLLGWTGVPAVRSALLQPLASLGIGDTGIVSPLSAVAAFLLTGSFAVTFGESFPKRLGLRTPERVALWSAFVLRALMKVSLPVRQLLSLITRTFGRGAGGTEADDITDRQELRLVISQLTALERLSPAKRSFLENLLEFSNTTARQIMVPRDAVEFLSLAKSLEQNLTTIRRSEHTRYPLCSRDIDSIIGMIHIKDLFRQIGGPTKITDLRQLKRDLPVVPETLSLDELQKVFEQRRAHMAQVLDEHGSIIGVVTLENVLEQLVGEIYDEFDTEEAPAISMDDTGLLVDGMMLVDELCRTLELDLEDGEAETVGGYVTESLGKIGSVGDQFRFGDFDGRVEEMEGRRISRVHLSHPAPTEAATGEQTL